MKSKRISILIAAVTLAIGGRAGAAPADAGVPRIAIDTRAFDLTTIAGQKQLDRAVHAAARKVCVVDGENEPLSTFMLQMACVRHALGSGRQQVAALMQRRGSGKNTMVALSTPRYLGSPKH